MEKEIISSCQKKKSRKSCSPKDEAEIFGFLVVILVHACPS
jgi:hypothetical protein